jgi:hypothetical protein
MNIAWCGLADSKYWELIARYCVPSWSRLPGKKFIIHDSDKINIQDIEIINWNKVVNNNAKFLKLTTKTKPLNFWRKMQSQIWAAKNLNSFEFLILLDTDIEILNFDISLFEKELENFNKTDLIWATGESNRKGHDSGFIILKLNHPGLLELINHYENIWESGDIFKLEKWYDGHAVESMFSKYPSYKIKNIDYGSGFHLYELGIVHYGSKAPKDLRSTHKGDGITLVQNYIKDKVVKKFK